MIRGDKNEEKNTERKKEWKKETEKDRRNYKVEFINDNKEQKWRDVRREERK